MPTVKLIADVAPNLLPMVRTPGVHISTLIDEICIELGHYKKNIEENQARFELGNALEHAIVERLALDKPDKYLRPGELMLDDSIGTPDLFEPHAEIDDEIKCTWMSANNGPGSKKFFKYEMQIKAYLHMVKWKRGRLHVVFLNGFYEKVVVGDPVYRVWEYLFSENELAANWSTLMKQKARKQR